MANADELGQVLSLSPTGIGVVGTRWVCVLRLLSTEILKDQSRSLDYPIGDVQLQWPLAKALSQLLQEIIQKQEEAEGEISLPKAFRERSSVKAVGEEPSAGE